MSVSGLCCIQVQQSDLYTYTHGYIYSGSVVKNPDTKAGDEGYKFDPWVGKIPWSRKWQAAPALSSGESHGQRSVAGYSPWGHKRVGHNLATEQQQYIYMGILFHILFHYRLLQDTDYSSLLYTVGPSAHFVYGSVYLLIPKA